MSKVWLICVLAAACLVLLVCKGSVPWIPTANAALFKVD